MQNPATTLPTLINLKNSMIRLTFLFLTFASPREASESIKYQIILTASGK